MPHTGARGASRETGAANRGRERSQEGGGGDGIRGFTSLDARAGQLGVGANPGNANTRDLTEGFLNAFKIGGTTGALGFGLANMLAGFAAPNITGPRAGLRGFVPEGVNPLGTQVSARAQERSDTRNPIALAGQGLGGPGQPTSVTQTPEFQALFDAIRARRESSIAGITPAPVAPPTPGLNLQPALQPAAPPTPSIFSQGNPQIAALLQALVGQQGAPQGSAVPNFGQLILGG